MAKTAWSIPIIIDTDVQHRVKKKAKEKGISAGKYIGRLLRSGIIREEYLDRIIKEINED